MSDLAFHILDSGIFVTEHHRHNRPTTYEVIDGDGGLVAKHTKRHFAVALAIKRLAELTNKPR